MIYSVEDDPAIRDLVLYALRQAGYEAEGFEDGVSFRRGLGVCIPRLVLLDQMLPNEDGEKILKRLRLDEKTRHLPVIMLTAKGSEMDKVRALDAGADDYIVKPFGVMELLSRVRAVLRRGDTHPDEEEQLSVNGLEMDVIRHQVKLGGREITLTNKEFQLLRFFMRNVGIVFSRDQLLDRVWDTSYSGDTRTVDMHIRSLRSKLGEPASAMLETLRGVGYRLAEITEDEGRA